MSREEKAIAPGTAFGRYEILSLLGEGGMGAVYSARDAQLQRDVALKVVNAADDARDRTWRQRFDAEARSVARLSHPNIVSVFDFGEQGGIPYMVSELVAGGSLAERLTRGPLSLEAALRTAIDIAEGLAEAHRRGIVHRDLKPANILLTPAGIPKIADFGLSKHVDDAAIDQARRTLVMTREGTIVGTPAYMSPEQAEGKAVDFRSDQFSFGTMLVEMVTGRRPFDRTTQVRTLAAIVSDPADLAPFTRTATDSLVAVVRRCLAKDPSLRYAATDDLVRELRLVAASSSAHSPRLPSRSRSGPVNVAIVSLAAVAIAIGAWQWTRRSTPETSRISSIAVLPLSNLSGSPQDEYVAAALTEELTSRLAAVRSLRVASRTSAAAYGRTKKPIPVVARELAVDGVIEGSVMRTGDRTRVTIQLIDAATDRHLWAEEFERDSRDVMTLQRDVGREVVERLHAALSSAERDEMARLPTRNPEAYDAYLHATYKNKEQFKSRQEVDEAVRYAEKAVALDPNFAEAWLELATACQGQMFAWKGGKAFDEKAYVAVQRALALKPSLAEAYVVRGVLNYNEFHSYDIAAALGDYRRAISLNPNLAIAHHNAGSELTHLGLHEEAIAEFHTALRLDPQMSGAKLRLARALWHSNRFSEALATYERFGIEGFEKAVVLAYLGRLDAAWDVATKEQELTTPSQLVAIGYDFAAARALIHAMRGDPQKAAEEIERAGGDGKGAPHFHHAACILAAAQAEMGHADEAVRWLQLAMNTGMPNYSLFRDNPSLRKLRGHPAYDRLLSDLRPRWEQIVSQVRQGEGGAARFSNTP